MDSTYNLKDEQHGPHHKRVWGVELRCLRRGTSSYFLQDTRRVTHIYSPVKVVAVIEERNNLRTMFKIHCQLRCRYNGEPDRDDDRITPLYQSKNIVK